MKQQFRRTALASLVMLMSATALVACGGGDDPAPAAVTPPPSGGSATAFATPSADTATAEGGFITSYNFVESTTAPKTETVSAPHFSAGVETFGHTIGGSQGWAGAALRFLAAGNTDATTGTSSFNASSASNLIVKMATTTAADTTIKLMLHKYTAAGVFDQNACVYTTTFTLTAPTTSTEYSVPLSSFTYPANKADGSGACPTDPGYSTVKAALYAVDVRNDANANGVHDVKVEYIKFQ